MEEAADATKWGKAQQKTTKTKHHKITEFKGVYYGIESSLKANYTQQHSSISFAQCTHSLKHTKSNKTLTQKHTS